METITKSKDYKTDNLTDFCNDVAYKIGFGNVSSIKMNDEVYKMFKFLYTGFVADCKLHNIEIDFEEYYSKNYITVYYKTKEFDW